MDPNLVAASAGFTLFGDLASIPEDPAYLYQPFDEKLFTDHKTTLLDIAITSIPDETLRFEEGNRLAEALKEIDYQIP